MQDTRTLSPTLLDNTQLNLGDINIPGSNTNTVIYKQAPSMFQNLFTFAPTVSGSSSLSSNSITAAPVSTSTTTYTPPA